MKEKVNMHVVVYGAGYVGLSLAVLLTNVANITLIDVNQSVINLINSGESPIKDEGLQEALAYSVSSNKLRAKLYSRDLIANADMIILAVPTNFDTEKNEFDTSILIKEIEKVAHIDKDKPIVIKSTIPLGFTEKLIADHGLTDCFYSPEFLREGHALYDNLNPSRIVVGSNSENAKKFVTMLVSASNKQDTQTIFTSNTNAELIKLASNSYLAMRVAFFNELDTLAMSIGLAAKDLVSGISLDPRIGNHYNNPSFGYGGYCLPKDVQQMIASFQKNGVEPILLGAVHRSNENRLIEIVQKIKKLSSGTIGIYRLQMKQGSDNLREAANVKIAKALIENGDTKVLIFEPDITLPSEFKRFQVASFDEFVNSSDLIVANRDSDDLKVVSNKVFTRDIYNES